MNIAISAGENHLKSLVDQHFGRCNWFCIFNTTSREHYFIENPVEKHQEKVGHIVAEFLIRKEIKIAVAGRFGAKVIDIFRKNNVQMVITEPGKTIEEIINQII